MVDVCPGGKEIMQIRRCPAASNSSTSVLRSGLVVAGDDGAPHTSQVAVHQHDREVTEHEPQHFRVVALAVLEEDHDARSAFGHRVANGRSFVLVRFTALIEQ